jgi:ankyrin repeat protein
MPITFWGYGPPYLPQITGTTADPDLVKDPDVTPLMTALYDGDLAKARELIGAGVNVNAADQHGHTALMAAAAGGDVATVQALLAAGADVDAKNKEGETALFSAAFLGRLRVAEVLVHHGAKVNVASQQGITPLMEAVQHSPAVVRFFGRERSGCQCPECAR